MKKLDSFEKGDVVNVTVILTDRLVRGNPVTVDKIAERQMHATDPDGFERIFPTYDFLFRKAQVSVCA